MFKIGAGEGRIAYLRDQPRTFGPTREAAFAAAATGNLRPSPPRAIITVLNNREAKNMEPILGLAARASAAAIVSFSLMTPMAYAAADMYLKLGDIKGEVSSKSPQNQIDILSYSWGASNPSTVGPGSSKARTAAPSGPGSLSVTMTSDVASAHLHQYCATGKHIPNAILYTRKSPSQAQYMQYKMEDVLVTCIPVPGGSTPMPVEEVTFTYQKIEWSMTPTTKEEPKTKDKYKYEYKPNTY